MAEGLEDFSLTLVGDGISIEKRVNKQVAMAVVAAVLGGGETVQPIGRDVAKVQSRERSMLSSREFLTESRASTNAEKITVLGHHICEHEGKADFTNSDIREAFRRIHEVIPKNLPRDTATAVKAGWIEEIPGKTGRHYVTNTGMNLVETRFGRER